MEMNSLNKNIMVKKKFEGGNPPVHALWKFLLKVGEFGNLVLCVKYTKLTSTKQSSEIQFVMTLKFDAMLFC